MHLGFPQQAGAVREVKIQHKHPLEIPTWMKPGKFKSFLGKEKLAGTFLGHDIITCSARRLFEAYPIRAF